MSPDSPYRSMNRQCTPRPHGKYNGPCICILWIRLSVWGFGVVWIFGSFKHLGSGKFLLKPSREQQVGSFRMSSEHPRVGACALNATIRPKCRYYDTNISPAASKTPGTCHTWWKGTTLKLSPKRCLFSPNP